MENKLELQIIKQVKPVIEFNFEDLEVGLQKTVEKYSNLVVTKQSLKACKETQRELASLRRKIDEKRKEIKREASIPIKEFEDRCKALMEIVSTVELPIKNGIQVYDEQVRDEKRKAVEALKIELIEKLFLNEKYAGRIQMDSRFDNITMSMKEIKISLTNQISNLKDQQDREDENRKTILNHIETMNSTLELKQPLKEEDFAYFMTGDLLNIDHIIQEISKRAKNRSESEKKAVNDAKVEMEKKAAEKPELEQMETKVYDSAIGKISVELNLSEESDEESDEELETSNSGLPEKEFTLKFKCNQITFNDITMFLFEKNIDFEEL